MPWVKLDEEFYDNPKWVGAPGDSIALWVAMIAWCNRNESTEGYIPAIKTQGLVNVRNLRATLADLCSRGAPQPVIRQVDDGYLIHAYAEYQQPEKVREIAAKRAAAGKKGASKRWGQTMANGMANGMANAIADATTNSVANGCPVTDPVLNSSSITTSSHRDGSDEMANSIERVADAITRWRARETVVRDWTKYLDAARPNVVAMHGPRIQALIEQFPLAPVDSIVHAIESGDTRNLAMFTVEESNVVELPARRLTPEERAETLRANGVQRERLTRKPEPAGEPA